MEREFVPYNQALKLKELGFDEPCFGYYVIDGEELIVEKWMQHPNKSTWTINAPTFSQAFRWFREKHKLNAISPTLLMYTTDWAFRIIDLNRMEDVMGCKTSNSYEEAELACLDKLIEIVDFSHKTFNEIG